MKLRNSIFIAIALLLSASCSENIFLRLQNQRTLEAVETIDNAETLSANSELPIRLRSNRLQTIPDAMSVTLSNRAREIISEWKIDDNNFNVQDFYNLPLGELNSDTYTASIELFQDDSSLGIHDVWFYYTEEDISVEYISVNPYLAQVGEEVEITLSLDRLSDFEPYAQLRMNNKVAGTVSAIDNKLYFTITAPSKPGIFDVEIDIFPWFETRIKSNIESSIKHNLELLVVPETTLVKPIEEHRIVVSDSINLDDNLFFYEDERVFLNIDIDLDTTNNSPLFTIGDGRFSFTLEHHDNDIEFNIQVDSQNLVQKIALDEKLQRFNIILYEGKQDITVLLTNKDRKIFADILTFDENTTSELSPFLGLEAQGEGEISISPIHNQVSLYRQISEFRHGSFLLYAEGFEFSNSEEINNENQPEIDESQQVDEPQQAEEEDSSKNQNISNVTSIDSSYRLIQPEEWLSFPVFALDEHSVNIEARFDPLDDLSGITFSLNTAIDNEVVFEISGTGQFLQPIELQKTQLTDFSTDSNIALKLSLEEGSLLINIQNTNTPIPKSIYTGTFYLTLTNTGNNEIGLDSIAISNTAEEFVDRVLDALP